MGLPLFKRHLRSTIYGTRFKLWIPDIIYDWLQNCHRLTSSLRYENNDVHIHSHSDVNTIYKWSMKARSHSQLPSFKNAKAERCLNNHQLWGIRNLLRAFSALQNPTTFFFDCRLYGAQSGCVWFSSATHGLVRFSTENAPEFQVYNNGCQPKESGTFSKSSGTAEEAPKKRKDSVKSGTLGSYAHNAALISFNLLGTLPEQTHIQRSAVFVPTTFKLNYMLLGSDA